MKQHCICYLFQRDNFNIFPTLDFHIVSTSQFNTIPTSDSHIVSTSYFFIGPTSGFYVVSTSYLHIVPSSCCCIASTSYLHIVPTSDCHIVSTLSQCLTLSLFQSHISTWLRRQTATFLFYFFIKKVLFKPPASPLFSQFPPVIQPVNIQRHFSFILFVLRRDSKRCLCFRSIMSCSLYRLRHVSLGKNKYINSKDCSYMSATK